MKPLGLSTGDPGGVGPEVSLRAAAEAEDDALVIFGDAGQLRARACGMGIAPSRLLRVTPGVALDLPAGAVALMDSGISWGARALHHEPTAAGGEAQLRALDAAVAAVRDGFTRALVTAPMSKSAVNLSGAAFSGHTEHLARSCRLADDEVTMMFLGPRLRVALVTTHLSLLDAVAAITEARVQRTVLHLAHALATLGDTSANALQRQRIGVAGLNPHAGEGGLFGGEEARSIQPAIDSARRRLAGNRPHVELLGPLGAETAFRLAAEDSLDGVVAMLHDQATIASKLLDWQLAVNVTWGLPFVRTSVDHGVAYDAAAAGRIDALGMMSAVRTAQRLTR